MEKRNQLEKDLMPDEDAVAADKENEPGQKNFAENKFVRRAFGGVKIVISEPPLSPQREESVATKKKESDDVLPKTAEDKRENITEEKKEANNKSQKESEQQKRNLRDIIGGFGKKKAIKAVTIKNRHQVV